MKDLEMVKVKSITDVITNSSTECFAMRDGATEKRIKELVNALLQVGGDYSHTFDDFFTFKRTVNIPAIKEWIDYEWIDEEDKPEKPIDEMTEEDWYYWAVEHDSRYDEHAPWHDIGVDVIAKDPLNEKAAELLSGLNTIFSLTYTSC